MIMIYSNINNQTLITILHINLDLDESDIYIYHLIYKRSYLIVCFILKQRYKLKQ